MGGGGAGGGRDPRERIDRHTDGQCQRTPKRFAVRRGFKISFRERALTPNRHTPEKRFPLRV